MIDLLGLVGDRHEVTIWNRTRAKADDPRPAFVYDDAIQHRAIDPTLPLPAEKIQWIQEQMVKAGKLKAPLDLKVVTAPEYRERALKVLGH